MPIQIRATVTSGHGWASQTTSSDVAALSAIEGAEFVAGTLNLVGRAPVWLIGRSAIYRNGGRAFWRGTLNGLPVIINRFCDCPAHVFEVYATTHLRSTLGLSDGDVVGLEISHDIVSVSDATILNKLVWSFFWKFREGQIYRDGMYLSFLRNRFVYRRTWRSMQRP